MQQFLDYIGSFRSGRRFIALEEERALLNMATSNLGLGLDDAMAALLIGARQAGLVLESEVAEETAAFLAGRIKQAGKIVKADFQAATDFFMARAGNLITPTEAARRVRQLVNRSGWTPARAGWIWPDTSWFDRIPDPTPSTRALVPPMPVPMATGGSNGQQEAGGGNAGDVLRDWAAALQSRNVDRIIALYTADALLLATAEDQPLIGPPQIRTYFNRLTSYEGLSVRFQQELQRLSSDRATLVSGLYTFTWLDPQTGSPVVTPARYSFAVRAVSGPGRIAMHHSSRVPGNYPGAAAI
ncbi:DUF4440 domain-containing protein [Thalassobaculum sp. OXR-137]|uniref:DUF4440 domain-containing protein n=1 Tax=Thalassobaculum sp. OXR-137 TaxID=3100173 RepID=UPI002AC8C1DE|nr:DUF4440 domain-containing protein [Thalassobaculum sp. OXR-137]WPZ34623.1 DUF4440 domain-containing protein [Thalassobaculum sp. OXR-137]